MVKVVISREIPKHWFALDKGVIAEEKVIGFLSLFIEERIVVVAFKAFHHVPRMAGPLVGLPVCVRGIYQMGATVLNSDGVAVIVKPRDQK